MQTDERTDNIFVATGGAYNCKRYCKAIGVNGKLIGTVGGPLNGSVHDIHVHLPIDKNLNIRKSRFQVSAKKVEDRHKMSTKCIKLQLSLYGRSK